MITLKIDNDRSDKLVRYLSKWSDRVKEEKLEQIGNATLAGDKALVKKLIIDLPLNGKDKQNIRTRMFQLLPTKSDAESEEKLSIQSKYIQAQADYIEKLEALCKSDKKLINYQKDLIQALNKQLQTCEASINIYKKLIDNYDQLIAMKEGK